MPKDARWSRHCPACGAMLYYSTKQVLKRQTASGGLCRACMVKRRAPTELAQAIVAAHARGLGNREIARAIGCHHRTVCYHLQQAGLTTNRPRGKPPVEVSPTTAICSACGREVAKTEFALIQSYADGRRLSKCRRCRREQMYRRLSTNVVAYTRDRQHRLKAGALKAGREYDLPDGHLLTLYDRQHGLCFYTDAVLATTVGAGWNPKALSVDRVDPDKGYIVGNVVLCARRVNSIKQDMTVAELAEWIPSWHARLMEAAGRGWISL